jgi:hypothetical protein
MVEDDAGSGNSIELLQNLMSDSIVRLCPRWKCMNLYDVLSLRIRTLIGSRNFRTFVGEDKLEAVESAIVDVVPYLPGKEEEGRAYRRKVPGFGGSQI